MNASFSSSGSPSGDPAGGDVGQGFDQYVEQTSAVSFCFDDGYAASCEAIATLFEERELKANFCVLTDPSHAEDPCIRSGKIGDFGLWRDLAARGHEIMPHGHRHVHLGQVSDQIARDEIASSLDQFLDGMADEAPEAIIYHCAYNHLPYDLRTFMAERFVAVRATKANVGRNRLAWSRDDLVFDAAFPMPPDLEAGAKALISDLIGGPPSWQVLCFHGLEPEGWGPIAPSSLAALLDLCLDQGLRVATPLMCIKRLSCVDGAGFSK